MTFTCVDCGQEHPRAKRCPVPNDPTKFRCTTCLREIDDLVAGPKKVARIRFEDVKEPIAVPPANPDFPQGDKPASTRRRAFIAKRGVALDPPARVATLARKFRGADVVVDVLDGGWYRWQDRTFPNLTSLAETICGYKVSGPAFFAKAERRSA